MVHPGPGENICLEEGWMPIRRVLHPTDLTPVSSKALAVSIGVARQNHADLILVHVLPPPTPIYEIESPALPWAEAALARLVEDAAGLGVKTKRVLIKGSGSISRHVVECAKYLHADLIVMGTHARTGIARWLVGSVAAGVVAGAHCPVLVLRGRSARAVSL